MEECSHPITYYGVKTIIYASTIVNNGVLPLTLRGCELQKLKDGTSVRR